MNALHKTLRVVLYHHITDDCSPLTNSLGVTTSAELFTAHLDYYQRHYAIVDLTAVIERRLPRRALLISFDDCYRSVASVAAPMLATRGLPGVAFVNTRCLETPRLMLDNLLSVAMSMHGAAAVARAIDAPNSLSAATNVAQLLDSVIAPRPWSWRRGLEQRIVDRLQIDEAMLIREHEPYFSVGDLHALRRCGIEIGCHTASHVHCRCLDRNGAEKEIAGAWKTLEAWAGQRVRAFSFPYGSAADHTPMARSVLEALGCEATFVVEGRCNSERLAQPLRRISPRDCPVERLAWELEVKPLLRACRGRLMRAA